MYRSRRLKTLEGHVRHVYSFSQDKTRKFSQKQGMELTQFALGRGRSNFAMRRENLASTLDFKPLWTMRLTMNAESDEGWKKVVGAVKALPAVSSIQSA